MGTLAIGKSLLLYPRSQHEDDSQRSTDFECKEVRSLKDKASTLQKSASILVSILSGIISIDGYSSYLDRSKDSIWSTTVAAVACIQTEYTHPEIRPTHQINCCISGQGSTPFAHQRFIIQHCKQVIKCQRQLGPGQLIDLRILQRYSASELWHGSASRKVGSDVGWN
jgi:hypothetical protein